MGKGRVRPFLRSVSSNDQLCHRLLLHQFGPVLASGSLCPQNISIVPFRSSRQILCMLRRPSSLLGEEVVAKHRKNVESIKRKWEGSVCGVFLYQ